MPVRHLCPIKKLKRLMSIRNVLLLTLGSVLAVSFLLRATPSFYGGASAGRKLNARAKSAGTTEEPEEELPEAIVLPEGKPLPPLQPVMSQTEAATLNATLGQQIHYAVNATRLYIYTYMGSGSTLLARLLDRLPDSMYWYEVMDSFYMAEYGMPVWTPSNFVTHYPDGMLRTPTVTESQASADFLSKLFSCRVEDLPAELFCHAGRRRVFSQGTGPFFECYQKHGGLECSSCQKGPPVAEACGRFLTNNIYRGCPDLVAKARNCSYLNVVKYNDTLECTEMTPRERVLLKRQQCLRDQKDKMVKCMPELKQECLKAQLRLVSEHRVAMESLGALLEKTPDLKVIHYVRHPGAMVMSRDLQNLSWPDGNSDFVTEAKLICSQMYKDIRTSRILERRHPNTFILLKHEDLLSSPSTYLGQLSKHLEYPLPEDIMSTRYNSLQYKKDGTFNLDAGRLNVNDTAHAWRDSISSGTVQAVALHCENLYKKLGYA